MNDSNEADKLAKLRRMQFGQTSERLTRMRGDPAALVDSPDICGSAGEREIGRITRDDLTDEFDLLERLLDLLLARQIGGDVDRLKLATEHSMTEPGDVGVVGCRSTLQPLPKVNGPAALAFAVAQRFGPIIVSVDEWSRFQHAFDAGRIILGGSGKGRGECKPAAQERSNPHRA